MATSPTFAATPRSAFANISTGNTSRTASGTTSLTSLFVAGSSGSRVDQIVVRATSSTSVGAVRLWIYNGSGNATLLDEISVPSLTPSATDPAFNVSKTYNNLFLPSGYTLYICPHNSESFNVFAFGGDF
jgi:hypothetical protein